MQLELTPDERFEIDPLGVVADKHLAKHYVRQWYPDAICEEYELINGTTYYIGGVNYAEDLAFGDSESEAWIAAANAIKRAVDGRKNTTT